MVVNKLIKVNRNINNFRTAMILCGGRGTRLGEIGKNTPKTLLKIQGKPILWYIIKILKYNKFNHIILPLGYRGNLIKKFIKKYTSFGIKIDCVHTGVDTNISKRISLVKKKILSENFLLLNGDAIFDFNLNKFFNSHIKNKIDHSFVSNEYVYPYGTIGVINNKKIVDFHRDISYDAIKTRGRKNYTAFNYSGISIIKKKLLLKFNKSFKNSDNFEKSFYPKIIKRKKLQLLKAKGFWHSVDNLKDLNLANSKKSINKFKQIGKIQNFLKKI